MTIRLSDGCVVTGTIRDGNGDPVPGAAVWPGDDDLIAFADVEGRYRIDRLWPGREYKVGLPSSRETQQVVTFERMGEEKHLDFTVPTPPARGLLVSVRFESPPQAEPHLSFDLGMKKPMRIPLPLRDSMVRCPVPLRAGQEVRLSAICPGFTAAEKTVTMPESETLVRVTLDLVPGGLPLYGRVVDEAGEPVAGAEVRVCKSPALDAGSYRTLTVWSDGRFRLKADPDRRHLIALSKGHGCSDWLHLEDGAREVVLVLTDACVAEGRVVDRDSGQPVAGVTVKLAFEMRGHGDWRTKSGEDGSYRFAGIPPETFVWPYVETTRRAEALDKPPDEHFDPAARSRTDAVEKGLAFRFERTGEVFRRDLPVRRNRGGTCRLVLAPPEGGDLPEKITVFHESRSDRWHRTSEWEVTLDAALPVVEIWMEEGTHSVRFRSGALSGQVIGIEVTGDGDLPEREVRLGKQARVLARLVDREGNRIRRKGVRVQLAQVVTRGRGHSGSGIGSAETNEAGEADVTGELPTVDNLDDESVSIRFTISDKAFFDASPFDEYVNLAVPGPELARRIRDAGGEDVVFEVPAWRYLRVPLVVLDDRGNPQAGVRLVCSPATEFEETEVVSDARGVVTLGIRFEPDRWGWDATVEATGPWVGEIDDDNCDDCFTRTKDGREVFVLTVSPCREVAVQIVDGEGRPLADQRVRYQPWYPGERMVTDGKGVVRLRLPEKETRITFDVEGHTTDWETVPAGVLEVRYTARRNRFVAVELVVPEALSAEREFTVDPVPEGERLKLERDAESRFRGKCEIPTGAAVELTVISPDRRWEARGTVGPEDGKVRLILEPRRLHPVALRLL
ncbi:MAG: carboxypeptidase-like regulatory domain-containing protein, partial [Planctomycetota bacterium]